jgi:hypothetical protein
VALTFADLERVRRELMTHVANAIAGLFGATIMAAPSSLGDRDGVEKIDGARDPDGQKGQRRVVRAQPFGWNGVPPKGLRVFWLKLGSGNVIMFGIVPQQSYGPQDLKSGESVAYNAVPSCQQLFDQNGNIKISSGTPNGGSQGDVQVNGGTAKIGRVGDTVDAGSLSTVIAVAGPAITVTQNWIPPGGGAPQQVFTFGATGTGVAGTTVVPLTGKISSGADHFKG